MITWLKHIFSTFRFENAINREQVIVVHSPFKTGTTTIGGALVLMGYANKDHGYHRGLNKKFKQEMDIANQLALNCESFEEFKSIHSHETIKLLNNLFKQTKRHKIFGDIPFGHVRIHPFVKKLFMPNAKFIWINREEDAWFNSARKWQVVHSEIYRNAEEKWNKNPEKEKQKLRKERNDAFKEFQKLQMSFPHDCLVISLEKASWEPLSIFLNLPIPNQDFPTLNKAKL